MSQRIPIRRTDREQHQIGSFEDGLHRYYDNVSELTVVKLFTGDCYVTSDPGEMLITILGSCVAVCARDPVARVGGMNHILLPGNSSAALNGAADECTRFGAFAMETLINGIIKEGGMKNRLEVKLFGGAKVMNTATMIGDRNIEFVSQYLANEGLRIISKDVGGELPRRIHYLPETGKVKLRRLQRKEDMSIAEKESSYVTKPKQQELEPDIELFD